MHWKEVKYTVCDTSRSIYIGMSGRETKVISVFLKMSRILLLKYYSRFCSSEKSEAEGRETNNFTFLVLF